MVILHYKMIILDEKVIKMSLWNFFCILTGLMIPLPLTRGGRRLLIFENNPGGLNTFVWRWKGATLLRLG